MRNLLLTGLFFLLAPLSTLQAQDLQAVWEAIGRPTGDPSHAGAVVNLTLDRDAIRINFAHGQIQFAQPTGGKTYAAAFSGSGRVQVSPPNNLEAQQLALMTGEERLDLEFTQAVLFFSDDTFNEVAKAVRWKAIGSDRTDLMKSRIDEQESNGTKFKPRLLQALMSLDSSRPGLFFADLKTKNRGWVEFHYDPLELEQVLIGSWQGRPRGYGFDTWMRFPAGGRSPIDVNANPGANAPFVTPAYTMDVTLSSRAKMTATVRATLQEHVSGERVFLFELDSNLRVDFVKDNNGDPLPFFQSRQRKDDPFNTGEYLAVALPAPSGRGRTTSLEFHYSGTRTIIKAGAGTFVCWNYTWYPALQLAGYERHRFEMTFRVPKKYTVVSIGAETSQTVQGGTRTSKWKSTGAEVTAGFAFAEFNVLSRKAGDINLQVFGNLTRADTYAALREFGGVPRFVGDASSAQDSEIPRRGKLPDVVLEQLTGILALFEHYFGPYPYPILSVADITFPLGQRWPSLLYLSAISTASQEPNMSTVDGTKELWRGHEISHQWWGGLVGWKTYHDEWLSEGFADFSGLLVIQFSLGFDSYLNAVKLKREALQIQGFLGYRNDFVGPVWMGRRLISSQAPGAYRPIVYSKGGLVLNTLRWMLRDPEAGDPDSRFITMMQEFRNVYTNGSATTEDFKAVAEKYMTSAMDVEGNHKLDWFFRQYVYGTGIPEYKLDCTLTNGEPGTIKASLTVRRRNDLGPGWVDILPVYAKTGKDTVFIRWLTVRGKETTTEFEIPRRTSGQVLLLNANQDTLADIQ
ncbi:MAG TPA: M1 family aminopeptidase [Candidatus Solibacter sp.]|nr:M1 family aminopeptidase [Candidatus Solibacter sp.]